MSLYLLVVMDIALAIERFNTNEDALPKPASAIIVRADNPSAARQVAHDFVFDDPNEASWWKDADITLCMELPTEGVALALTWGKIYSWDDTVVASKE